MSTLLYRSPNIVIDAHEWHMASHLHRSERTSIAFYWRPLGAVRGDWKGLASWQGPKPKRMWSYFSKYRPHALAALESERKRLDAVRRIKQLPATAAMRANAA